MNMTVGELERALFEVFPEADAEEWDNPGLVVGDRSDTITKIAFSMNPSANAILLAADAGCNVLVTHHPILMTPAIKEFSPQDEAMACGPGRAIYEAARCRVSVISMHTNADRSPLVRKKYADMFGINDVSNFEYLQKEGLDSQAHGFGVIFETEQDKSHILENLSSKCSEIFETTPRVWGWAAKSVTRFAMLNGAWNDPEIYDICVANGIDAIVVGETRYHFCVEAQPHLAVIDLGHGISELPIVDVLMDAVADKGVSKDYMVKLVESQQARYRRGSYQE